MTGGQLHNNCINCIRYNKCTLFLFLFLFSFFFVAVVFVFFFFLGGGGGGGGVEGWCWETQITTDFALRFQYAIA